MVIAPTVKKVLTNYFVPGSGVSNSIPVLSLLLVVLILGCKKDTVVTPATSPTVAVAGKSYYVSDLTGSDNNAGLSAASPFKKISTAAKLAAAGDTVFIMNGTYSSVSSPILTITQSGTADRYITFKAYPGQTPKLFASGSVWNAVVINGSFIVFEGIELQGNNANITFANATASYKDALAGGTNYDLYAQFNTNAISIGGPKTDSKFPHHVIIRNCKVHDFPGGGISSIQADYTTIEGNTVYNNAWYMMYAGSGISILTPFNSDAVTTYKNIVRNNICYNNKTTIPWIGITPSRLSDGNGIIIDVNQSPYGQTSGTPYGGRTLVENNVSYNNGGSGIHAYKANHVDIINNTGYNNGQVVGYAEIYANSCSDVKIANNIMYARNGGSCNSNSNNSLDVVSDYNIYYNGSVAVQGLHDRIANPGFTMTSSDPLVARFDLITGSTAVDAGTKIIFAEKDILGVKRPQGGAVDCGAYESH